MLNLVQTRAVYLKISGLQGRHIQETTKIVRKFKCLYPGDPQQQQGQPQQEHLDYQLLIRIHGDTSKRSEQRKLKGTVELSNNYRIWRILLVTKKGSKVLIGNCGSPPMLHEEENTRGVKLPCFTL